MTLLHRLASILRWMFRRNQAERDLHDELEAFADMAAADQVRDGATAAEARRRAALQLGGLEQAKERVRGARHGAWLDVAGRDVRYGLRQVRRNPAFSAIAIAPLALGIGGITAMFSAFDAVLIRPLPYTDADRLVMIWDATGEADVTPKHNSTPAEWIEWRRLNTVFTDLAATQPADVTLSGGDEPEQIPGRTVTWTFWSVLGVQPLLGRVFTEDEDNKSVRVVVISYGLWQRRFGGASDIIGRVISLNDEPYELIGVIFAQLDGKILLVGCDHDNVTFLHYAEHIVVIPGRRIVRFKVPVDENGTRVWKSCQEFDSSGRGAHPNWPNGFFARIVNTHLRKTGNAGGRIGDARAYLLPSGQLLTFALEVMAAVARDPPTGMAQLDS